MARKVIKEDELNVLYHHTGITRFRGCQCIKDCSCNEDFKPSNYDYYTVVRKGKKTTFHNTLQEAEIRWDYVCGLAFVLK
jgi:hypothetical protein